MVALGGGIFAGESFAAEDSPGVVSQAMAPRSGPRGATLFAELPASATGLLTENKYADPRMWGERFRQFETGAIGTGIAVGDYDGDGRPDIFVVSKTESCRLFRNLGNWKFEDVTETAGVGDRGEAAGIWKQGAAFADVNNDGKLDLYVCRFDAPNLLYINQGNGTFVESAAAYRVAVNDASNMAAFCDYDRDGWLDLYLQTNYRDTAHPNGQRDYLFRNNRNGTFTEVTTQAGIAGESYGHSATWWDYDHDGWPDLYVANDFSAPDKLYRNNHDGTFTDVISRAMPRMPFSAMGADLADVNNDGLIDLLVGEMAATTHEKDMRAMAEVRSRGQDPADGSAEPPQYLSNALYLNTGTGRFLEAAFLAGLHATDWTWSLRFEDLDNDGRVDLHVTNGMFREIHNTDLVQKMLSAENPAERVRFSRGSPVLTEQNLAFRNEGDLRFEDVSAAWGLAHRGVSFGAAFGDFDGDGDLDLVFANYQGGMTVMRNDSDVGHRVEIRLQGTKSNRFGVGARVTLESAQGRQVRELVLARGYLSTSEPMLHFGLGADDRVGTLTIEWPGGATQTLHDLAADRVYTITEPADAPPAKPVPPLPPLFVESSATTGVVVTMREAASDELSIQPLLPMRHNRAGPSLAVGDLAGDGTDGMLVGGTTRDALKVFAADAAGCYAVKSFPAAAGSVNDGPILLFDANADGRLDVLVTRSGAVVATDPADYQPQLWLGSSDGWRAAGAAALPALAISVGVAAAADFDHDGQLDVFLGGRLVPGEFPLSPTSALLRNVGGKFEDITDTLAPALRQPGMVTSALWSDVDNDGWPDLLLALDWGGVRYFHNDAGRGFSDRSEAAGFAAVGTGWWTSLAAADFNGDGKLDYAVGNVGLNTPYRADARHPAVLFYGQFGEGVSPEIVEGYYEGERLLPRRVRRQLAPRVPGLLKRFPSSDRYARATLPEILGADRLAAAERWAATELRSGVFLSQPDGTFRFSPLPTLAQVAPLQGMVAGDFDGDGIADLVAVQNSYAPAPSVGRFDGGLGVFLQGDGRGDFTALPALASGLVVPGDAKALAVADLNRDGLPDLVVTRNNDTALTFTHATALGTRWFRVVLHGKTGNPTAIGARVRFELADGSAQTLEVSAGSGHFSQSSPALFFSAPAATAPKAIRVRWPSGAESSHEITASSGTVVINEPASR